MLRLNYCHVFLWLATMTGSTGGGLNYIMVEAGGLPLMFVRLAHARLIRPRPVSLPSNVNSDHEEPCNGAELAMRNLAEPLLRRAGANEGALANSAQSGSTR